MVKLICTINGKFIEPVNTAANQYAYQLFQDPTSLSKVVIYGHEYLVESVTVVGQTVKLNLLP